MKNITKNDLLAISLEKLYFTESTSMKEVTMRCLGLQAQFSMNPYYSLKIRSNDYDEEIIMKDYVKTWSFRGTMHFVHKDDLTLHLSARGITDWNSYWGLSKEENEYWSSFLLNEISKGNSQRKSLKEAAIKAKIEDHHFEKVFHGWGGVLQDMCYMGLIAYDASTKKNFVSLDSIEFIDKNEARLEMIRRYFLYYGPATIDDCAYYTGYRKTEVMDHINGLDLKMLRVEGNDYYYLGNIPETIEVPEIVILTGFDPLILGYKDKSRFMDETERSKYVTNTGIIFPGILVNGRLGARWQKSNKSIIVKPYKKLLKRQEKTIVFELEQLFPQLSVIFEERI